MCCSAVPSAIALQLCASPIRTPFCAIKSLSVSKPQSVTLIGRFYLPKGTSLMPHKPNLLLVISDQFRADNLGCLGNPMNLTPNLDAMAARGTLFRCAVANNPLCAPARACMFSGQYQEKNGVWRNQLYLRPGAKTLASALRENGYTANYIGKWHLAPNNMTADTLGPVAPQYRGGFLDFWEASNVLELVSHPYEGDIFDGAGKSIHYAGVHRADFLTDRAVRFLNQQESSKPFFLTVSYLNVHHQNDIDAFVPPERYADRFRNPFIPADLRALPGSWPSQLADYYGCVAAMDDQIGRLLRTLREQGLEQNTIVVFISDHGCHFKTRSPAYKQTPHESSIRVPLIIQGPGFNGPVDTSEIVSQVDLMPSLLDAMAVEIPATVQGKSFLPLLQARNHDWRNEAYIAITGPMTGKVLRTPQWTYAAGTPKVPGWKPAASSDSYVEYMMYDLYADPAQLVNMAGRAETQTMSERFRERLAARITEAGGARPDIAPPAFRYM